MKHQKTHTYLALITIIVFTLLVTYAAEEQSQEDFEQDANVPQNIRSFVASNPDEFGSDKLRATAAGGATTLTYGSGGPGVEIPLTQGFNLGGGLGGLGGGELGSDDHNKLAIGPESSITYENGEITAATINVPPCLDPENCVIGPKEYEFNGVMYKAESGSTIEFTRGVDGEADHVTISVPDGTAIHRPDVPEGEQADLEVTYQGQGEAPVTMTFKANNNNYAIKLDQGESITYTNEDGHFTTRSRDIEVDGARITTYGWKTGLLFGEETRTGNFVAFNRDTKEITVSAGTETRYSPLVEIEGLTENNPYDIPMQESDRIVLRSWDQGQATLTGQQDGNVPEITIQGLGAVMNGYEILMNYDGNIYRMSIDGWNEATPNRELWESLLGFNALSSEDKARTPQSLYATFTDSTGARTQEMDYLMQPDGSIPHIDPINKDLYANVVFNTLSDRDRQGVLALERDAALAYLAEGAQTTLPTPQYIKEQMDPGIYALGTYTHNGNEYHLDYTTNVYIDELRQEGPVTATVTEPSWCSACRNELGGRTQDESAVYITVQQAESYGFEIRTVPSEITIPGRN